MKFKNLDNIYVLILVLAALAFRLFLLWLRPDLIHHDHSIVALMAKHILEKGEFPIFFYGQNWFGSIESFLHAFYFLIFGISIKTLSYAPLTFFALFLLGTYLLAKKLFNGQAGLWALAWCIFPPIYLLDYGLNPQGGYIETLSFGTLVLLLSVYLVQATQNKTKWILFLTTGFMGGLSWWTSPLSVHYLIAAALFILLVLRRQILSWKTMAGILAFMIASLPFWIYQITKKESLGGFSSVFSIDRLSNGLSRLFTADLPVLLDATLFKDKNILFSIFILVFYGTCTLYFILTSLKKLIIKRDRDSCPALLVLFLLTFSLIYSLSELGHRGLVRYLLPLFSFIPIAVGLFLSRVTRFWKFLPLLILSCVALPQGYINYERYRKAGPHEKAIVQGIDQLSNCILEKGISRAIAPYYWSGRITFISKEKLIVATPTGEKYPPYERDLETYDQPAFLFENIKKALKYLGGKAASMMCGPFKVYHSFEEPQGVYQQIPQLKWNVSASENGNKAMHAIDRNIDFAWHSIASQKPGTNLTLDLGEIYPVGMIRIINHPKHFQLFPRGFKIEVSSDFINWKQVAQSNIFFYYYWSGPRLYPWNPLFRWEIRFQKTAARYIRITQTGNHLSLSWNVNEIYVYEERSTGKNSFDGLENLLNFLNESSLKFIYADRWISAKIKEYTHGKINTFPTYTDTQFERPGLPSYRVHFGKDVGFILGEEDVDSFMEEIKDFNFDISQKHFGFHILIYFNSWPQQIVEQQPFFFWTGFGIIKGNSKQWSKILESFGSKSEQAGHDKSAIEHYKKSLQYYPNNQNARKALLKLLQMTGSEKKAQIHSAILNMQIKPQHECFILFENETQFLGYSMLPAKDNPAKINSSVHRGETIRMVYYWRIKKPVDPKTGVFVHIEGQGSIFQGDHKFLEHAQFDPLFENEIFREETYLTVPNNIPPGPYKIRMGLFNTKTGKRWKIKTTDLEHQDERVDVGNLEVN